MTCRIEAVIGLGLSPGWAIAAGKTVFMITVILLSGPNLKVTNFNPRSFERPEYRMRTSVRTGILYRVLPVIIVHLL